MHKIIILFLFLKFSLPLYAQENTKHFCYDEQVFVHTNNSVYMAGEKFFFKAYISNLLSPKEQALSKVIYFQLVNVKGENVYSWESNCNYGNCYGSVYLPDSLQAGFYLFRAYTQWMLNFPDHKIFERQLVIIGNTGDDIEKVGYFNIKESNPTASQNFIIQGVKPNYGQNETVSASLELLEGLKNANLSVSVSAKCFEDVLQPEFFTYRTTPLPYNKNLTCKYLLEDLGKTVTGTIVNTKTGLPVNEAKVLLSGTDSIPWLKTYLTGNDGRFYFQLDNHLQNKFIYVQVFENNIEKGSLKCIPDSKACSFDVSDYDVSEIKISKSERQFLDDSRSIFLTGSVYNNELHPNIKAIDNNRFPFFGVPEYERLTVDYEPLINFVEITDNLLMGITYRNKKGHHSFQYLNEDIGGYNDIDLIILNGLIFQNRDFLINLGTKDVKSIAVNKSTFMIGDLDFNGIISVQTYKPDLHTKHLEGGGCNIDNRYHTIDMDKGEFKKISNDKHFPDFRNTLFWEPDMKVKDNIVEFEFQTSLYKADYQILIHGTLENGEPVNLIKEFTVK